jgi:hypothetical protein
MTKQEFLSRQQDYKNISGKGAIIAVSLVFTFSCVTVGIIVLMITVKSDVKPAWFGNIVFSAVSAMLTLFIVTCLQLLLRFFRLRMTKLELLCAGCGTPLIGRAFRTVITTGCCRRCGRKVIDDTPDA